MPDPIAPVYIPAPTAPSQSNTIRLSDSLQGIDFSYQAPENPDERLFSYRIVPASSGQSLLEISGEPSFFDSNPDAVIHESLASLLSELNAAYASPHPSLTQFIPRDSYYDTGLFISPDLRISSIPDQSDASSLAAILRDTGPLTTSGRRVRESLCKRYPNLFFTKSASLDLVAARAPTFLKKPKKASRPTASPSSPIAEAAGISDKRLDWLLDRGFIPPLVHNTALPFLSRATLVLRTSQSAPHLCFAFEYSRLLHRTSYIRSSTDPDSIIRPNPIDELDASATYAEQLETSCTVNASLNSLLKDILTSPLSSDLSCLRPATNFPAHVPNQPLPIPSSLIFFFRKFRPYHISTFLAYYTSYLPLLRKPIEACPRLSSRDAERFTSHNRAFAATLTRFSCVMGFRSYPAAFYP